MAARRGASLCHQPPRYPHNQATARVADAGVYDRRAAGSRRAAPAELSFTRPESSRSGNLHFTKVNTCHILTGSDTDDSRASIGRSGLLPAGCSSAPDDIGAGLEIAKRV